MTSNRIRCYIPLTARRLADEWPHPAVATAYAPATEHRDLPGEAGEEAEYRALLVAAAVAADQPAPITARVVLAYDLSPAEDATGQPITDDVVGLRLSRFDPTAVVSAHVDEAEVVDAARANPDVAGVVFAEAALLWYDRSEIGDLVEAFAD